MRRESRDCEDNNIKDTFRYTGKVQNRNLISFLLLLLTNRTIVTPRMQWNEPLVPDSGTQNGRLFAFARSLMMNESNTMTYTHGTVQYSTVQSPYYQLVFLSVSRNIPSIFFQQRFGFWNVRVGASNTGLEFDFVMVLPTIRNRPHFLTIGTSEVTHESLFLQSED
jgi:hypothetical protein